MPTVTKGAAVATDDGMPPKPQPQAMTPKELRELMEAHGHSNTSLAELLDVHRNTVSRWLLYVPGTKKGTPIDAANALLIRTALKSPKK